MSFLASANFRAYPRISWSRAKRLACNYLRLVPRKKTTAPTYSASGKTNTLKCLALLFSVCNYADAGKINSSLFRQKSKAREQFENALIIAGTILVLPITILSFFTVSLCQRLFYPRQLPNSVARVKVEEQTASISLTEHGSSEFERVLSSKPPFFVNPTFSLTFASASSIIAPLVFPLLDLPVGMSLIVVSATAFALLVLERTAYASVAFSAGIFSSIFPQLFAMALSALNKRGIMRIPIDLFDGANSFAIRFSENMVVPACTAAVVIAGLALHFNRKERQAFKNAASAIAKDIVAAKN